MSILSGDSFSQRFPLKMISLLNHLMAFIFAYVRTNVRDSRIWIANVPVNRKTGQKRFVFKNLDFNSMTLYSAKFWIKTELPGGMRHSQLTSRNGRYKLQKQRYSHVVDRSWRSG